MKTKWIVFAWCLVSYWISLLNADGLTLEGQSKGSTNWIGQNLQNWKELDYFPLRATLTGGPASNQVAVVGFDHGSGATPGIEDLTGFVPSSNVVLKSAVLSAPAGASSWSYTFTVDLKDSSPGTIQFFGRLSAGAHLNSGSSLHLSPSLQIHKPAAAPGNPDLMVVKTGPAHAAVGQTITYTVLYTNISSQFNTAATGVQIGDELPSWVTYVPGSATGGGVFSGNILTWDLNGLAVGQGGTVTYQAVVSSDAVVGQSFQNVARIFSAEDDANTANNQSTATTIVDPAIVTNSPPVAVNDSYTIAEDSILAVVAPGVLLNDTDVDGDSLTTYLLTTPSHGAVVLNTNGSFVYTPASNYFGSDSFTYNVSDGTVTSSPATVNITVTPVNDPPVAVNDSYVTDEDVALNIAAPGVLGNDSDIDGDPLSAIVITPPSHGTLSLSTNGSFVYTPAANFNGGDSFTYSANDGKANSSPATVAIIMNSRNDAPVVVNDSYNINEDTTLIVSAPGVLTNDFDADGDALSTILVTPPTHGSLTFNTNGSFTYVPATNYNGTDSFTYRATDGITSSGIATVTIVVAPVNDAPVAVGDNYTTAEDLALNVAAPGILGNDTDVDGDNLRAILVTPPAHGTLTLNTNGSFVYTPTFTFNGSDSFTYRANDGKTNSGVATVTISVSSVNDAPVANNDSYSTDEDTALNIAAPGVLGNDTDVDGDSLSVILVTSPAHGTLTLNANGSFTYTPALNFNGNDSFTYKANDGITNSAAATVSILVKAKNDPPTFTFGIGSYVVNEDSGPQAVPNSATNISAGAADESGQVLTFTVTNDNTALFSSQPALTPAGTLVFTPAPNAFGTSLVTAVLRDNGGTSNGGSDTSVPHTFSIVVNPVNDAPSFTEGLDQLINQGATNQTVTNWATDISVGPANESGQNVSFVLTNDNPSLFIDQPQIDTNGTLTYTAAPATNGVAHVSVVIQDDGGTENGGVDTSLPQDFIITINGPPVAKIIAPTNGSVIIASTLLNVLCNATDPDGTVTNLALFCNGTLISNLTQPYLCSLPNLAPGSYQLTATATDNLGLTGDAAPVNFTVINQAPISILVAMHFNPQTGLFEQTVQIGNPTPNTIPGVRIFAANLTNGASLYNASGSSNGVSYVQYNYPIPPGQSGTMIIEYYVPSRITPDPVLTTELVPPAPGTYVTGAQTKIDRVTMLSDGTALLDFKTLSNRCYYVQYSCDMKTWQTVTPCMTGTGSGMQWLDNGPPKTEAKPCDKPLCVYRVLLMP